jgi:hypothetical protein
VNSTVFRNVMLILISVPILILVASVSGQSYSAYTRPNSLFLKPNNGMHDSEFLIAFVAILLIALLYVFRETTFTILMRVRDRVRNTLKELSPKGVNGQESPAETNLKHREVGSTEPEPPQIVRGDLQERVRKNGGSYDGCALRITLMWDNTNDLDLYVTVPNGETISYVNKESSCGGVLDIDMNVDGASGEPVENVVWASSLPRQGTYKVLVNVHEVKGMQETNYMLEINDNGSSTWHNGKFTGKQSDVYEFDK